MDELITDTETLSESPQSIAPEFYTDYHAATITEVEP
jgi:hypothetical protein